MSYAVVNPNSEILAVHAALLRTGDVLYFSGSQHRFPFPDVDATRIWHPDSYLIDRVTSPTHDLFCSGQAFLPNGNLLVGGGTQFYSDIHGGEHGDLGHFRGLRDTVTFDVAAGSWRSVGRMVPQPARSQGGGRWYPTLLTLGSGRVLAMSGHPENSDTRHVNWTMETFDSASGNWSDVGRQQDWQLSFVSQVDFYPRLHLLPSSQVVCSTPMSNAIYRWNSNDRSWTRIADPPGAGYNRGFEWSSVLLPLLPPDYRARVLVVGKEVARIIDLGGAGADRSASWRDTASRTLPEAPGRHPANARRAHCNAVILPDGKVLVLGGSHDDGYSDTAVLAAELYDPVADTWTTLGSSLIPRGYHSVALLLADGRVWVAGSDFNDRRYPEGKEFRIELFSPPYLAAENRPIIRSAPGTVRYASTFSVEIETSSSIVYVSLVRCSSVTHAFNSDQRYLALQFTRDASSLTVEMPANPNLAPPGPYLLFVLNEEGIPSVGRVLSVEMPSIGALEAGEGTITFLRVHEIGSGIGPDWDFLDVEGVVALDSRPELLLGFRLREDGSESARRGMLDLARTAFNRGRRVQIDYIRTGILIGEVVRIADVT